jgi:hypothetical protein
MGTKTSKKKEKITSYQKLKMRLEHYKSGVEAMIERPHTAEAKAFRINYKLENDLM